MVIERLTRSVSTLLYLWCLRLLRGPFSDHCCLQNELAETTTVKSALDLDGHFVFFLPLEMTLENNDHFYLKR
jgi:hypothetical protein